MSRARVESILALTHDFHTVTKNFIYNTVVRCFKMFSNHDKRVM